MTAPVVAVLGAGAAGLAGALELCDQGHSPVVIEAAARAGGKVSSIREGGYLMERAALGLLDRQGDLAPLAQRLGLALLPAGPRARNRWVYRDGKLRTPFATLSFAEKLSLLGEPWRKAGDPLADSVTDFCKRRLGKAGAFLADALQTGIYAGDPDRLSLAACFPSLAELERTSGSLARGMMQAPKSPVPRPRLASFAGGLQELTSALAARLGPCLRLSTSVRKIFREGARYRLSLRDPGGVSELLVDRLLIALPAPDAADALDALDPALADELRALKAAPIAMVHLGVKSADVLARTDGFGLIAPGSAQLGTLLPASLWEGRAPAGHVLLSTLVGGAQHPAAAGLPDDELVAAVREELHRTLRLRLDSEPSLVRIVRWPQAVPQYERGHLERVASLEARAGAHAGLRLTGAWYRGVSVLDCLRDGKAQARALAALH